ncbi:MAG: cytochrome P460 family protein [Terriglobus sp.]
MQKAFVIAASFLCTFIVAAHAVDIALDPEKTMAIPANYREWIYMTSGIDMTYAAPGAVGLTQEHHSVFDNVFVNPDAWQSFKQTGHWPNGTTFVLENRTAEDNVSINKGGHTQSSNISGLEIHQKRNNEWTFYVRGKDGAEHLVPRPASCYTCHESHGAADTTFAQFYPTALPIATEKNTLSDVYRTELSTPATK